MIANVMKLITSSVGIMIRKRWIVYRSILIASLLLLEPEGLEAIDAEERARIPVVEAFLRHVHQRVARDHRLRHARDDADHVLLVDMDAQHLVPEGGALVARLRRRPVLVELGELLHLGDVGRLAVLAAGLVV